MIHFIFPFVFQSVLKLMEPDEFLAGHDTCHAVVSAIRFAVPHIRLISLQAICPEYYDILVGIVNWNIYRLNVNRRIEFIDCLPYLTGGLVADFLSDDFTFVRYPEHNDTSGAVDHTA